MNEARLSLAEQILELAEHSSEAEMRSSLSRIYYAAYHVALVLVGSKAHGEIPDALEGLQSGLGRLYTDLLTLRQRADYDPGFVLDSLEMQRIFAFNFLSRWKKREHCTSDFANWR